MCAIIFHADTAAHVQVQLPWEGAVHSVLYTVCWLSAQLLVGPACSAWDNQAALIT